MSHRLFGTDGVRGKAGRYPLDHETVARLGAALVRAMRPAGEPERTLHFAMGRDTRESGEWIERELARGVHSAGAYITSAGVIPTPAIAYVTRAMGFDAGLVISASHNPFDDNGIKVFSGKGEKFTETLEREVEAIIHDTSWSVNGNANAPVDRTDVIDAYIAHARLAFPEPGRLGRFKIAVDTANGATTTVAPRLFDELGFDVVLLSASPDGRNINRDCGSTHPEQLSAAVREQGCRMGVAFDGDGDRAIFADASGRIVDGDAVLLMCARQMQRTGRLNGNAIVATVMSNIGLEIALRESGIDLVRCPVGDKYVMEEMLRRGLSIGGEQSGHIIVSEHLFTGDGIVTALSVLRVMAETGRELADLASELVTYPQVLVNVRVREWRDLRSIPAVATVMERVERQLAGQGRLLVRYSGTEPLLRVMLEGRDQQEIQGWAAEIAAAVTRELGG
ncbi:MAG: phosphoglucosamine mutase [Acidobacteria bacterium RIFCSPLOWO2_02_FULL_67_36]|nr:MAG: phosphoglucosamine mutase [Acidobacteria bacterium RIFCSPLOWO2_02_FULL_67_36]